MFREEHGGRGAERGSLKLGKMIFIMKSNGQSS